MRIFTKKLLKVGAVAACVVCLLCVYQSSLYNRVSKSLTEDIAAQLIKDKESFSSPSELCGRYFQKLYELEPDWWNNYSEGWQLATADYETQNLRLIMERLRTYEGCLKIGALPSDVRDLDKRMFPFIRLEQSPIFESGDLKKTYKNGQLPLMSSEAISRYQYDSRQSWLTNWNRTSQEPIGPTRGIVLSFPDVHVSLVIRLLKVLEHQKNRLPIQIIHKGDLSDHSKTLISKALPPNQRLWFVNVKPMLDPQFIDDFTLYRNKWLAMIFNTFSTPIFIDADAVSAQPIESYLHSEAYVESGTLFFRDRAFAHKFDYEYCVPLLKSLQPSQLETLYFGRRRLIDEQLMISDSTSLEQRIVQSFFVGGQRHQMDSGLLAIDKSKHAMPLMAGVFLNLAPKLSKCTHGDKEVFWLAFLLTNHAYRFHPEEASAIGEDNGSGEVCSVQLGHTSTHGTLLWFNSGFRVCKFADAIDIDWEGHPKDYLHETFATIQEAREYYESMTRIKVAALPDISVNPWAGGFADLCIGYRYCAKVSPGSGQLISFSAEEQENLREIGEAWMSATEAVLKFRA
ncbi:LAQU0S11e01024g1_1 [Lachancea quebecensis]|uniref:LAQU0S11e01024g1_1 n=1 Tax=Lachancea quebecensis TaxID=1654605 RepID=A0A0P1KWH0_9SACH|nr:LAQU0S11e01024g1_1 [Lachancea quebecensis]